MNIAIKDFENKVLYFENVSKVEEYGVTFENGGQNNLPIRNLISVTDNDTKLLKKKLTEVTAWNEFHKGIIEGMKSVNEINKKPFSEMTMKELVNYMKLNMKDLL